MEDTVTDRDSAPQTAPDTAPEAAPETLPETPPEAASGAGFAPRTDVQAIERGDRFAPRFDAAGLMPAVVQDAATGQVLMLAYMNAEAVRRTLATGEAHYFSRSRNALWRKGERSGHVQKLVAMRTDCDQDTVLLTVEQTGPGACHVGYRSCFYRRLAGDPQAPGLVTEGAPAYDPDRIYAKEAP
ncbi:phosphoribosyl-AMP cyclohydrolase [Rhodothalassium salexigens DSM 2132]|uniref:Phosphoribosyl-AMP cyclohydrolase n=1 Tax=Rhodothalassium salexigens DSM 2132 TaxID=1188247 RepID=A0A4R2PFN1_RHOSA|nr:phosphoribosyl-AMP cyclohydrolase [Rhodothalassium salexigens]MBK1639843.1 phosphoribosyl-AMP cyclohydrolase [Rhodothalassium salexigens DSM 2132]TCP33967.1 phosphoribosyl-AMP cyclohydrolase [Rhodothalassium salexigens DSM 2132]